MTILAKSTSFFNPYLIEYKGRTHELKDIKFYDKKGNVISVGRGWFGNNNILGSIVIPFDIVLRRKEKFDGEAFIVPRQKEYYERNKRSKCDIYLPMEEFFEHFQIEKNMVPQDQGFRIESFAKYQSKSHPEMYFYDYNDISLQVNEAKKAHAINLRNVIKNMELELKKLKKELEILDPYDKLSKGA